MTALLIIIFIFFVLPRIMFWLLKYSVKQKIRSNARQFEEMFGRATGQEQPQPSRKAGWTRPARNKPKKIDSRVGEFVNFTEISATTSSASYDSDNRYWATEQQIIDADWEDISDKQ